MLTDPIADLLTRIRNGYRTNKKTVFAPYSRHKHEIAKVIAESGFIEDVTVEKNNQFSELKISLKTSHDIPTLKRISKPGQRIHIKSTEIKKVCNGLGISIISTSKGIMTNQQARQKKMGGELICEIY